MQSVSEKALPGGKAYTQAGSGAFAELRLGQGAMFKGWPTHLPLPAQQMEKIKLMQRILLAIGMLVSGTQLCIAQQAAELKSVASQSFAPQKQEAARQLQFTLSLQPGYNTTDKVVNLHNFEVAAGWSRRPNRLMEIGLNNISLNTRKTYFYNSQPLATPTVTTNRSLGLNVAYYVFFRHDNARFKPYVSAGWATQLSQYKNNPGIRTSFPSEALHWYNSLLLSPGIRYQFSGLFLKLEAPLTAIHLDSSYQRVQNPAIPIRSQEQYKLAASYFPFGIIPLEIGIGYRLAR
ncbi:hypothetical protein [Cesiribacter sp. SM1]|uniref:hypothetical protein n=1 Tax=Cesiribacter sp. SM1 TaxID=2861196 RepID=UPI001CD4E254|nr:hypothetical protein [Cesiribacter sp. SM1]